MNRTSSKDECLKHLLLDRVLRRSPSLRDPEDSQLSRSSRSRREFLQGGGISIAALASPTFLHPQPQIIDDGTALRVFYGSATWTINSCLFGTHAKLRWFRDDDKFFISLKKAFLPGTTFAASFEAVLFRAGRDWNICFSMPHIRFEGVSELFRWLSRKCECSLIVT